VATGAPPKRRTAVKIRAVEECRPSFGVDLEKGSRGPTTRQIMNTEPDNTLERRDPHLGIAKQKICLAPPGKRKAPRFIFLYAPADPSALRPFFLPLRGSFPAKGRWRPFPPYPGLWAHTEVSQGRGQPTILCQT